MRTWTQFGPKASFSPRNPCGEVRDRARKLFVRLFRALPLGIVAQQDGGVITDPLGDRVDGDASIEESSCVDAPQIVKSGGHRSRSRSALRANSFEKFRGLRGVTRLNSSPASGTAGEHQRAGGQAGPAPRSTAAPVGISAINPLMQLASQPSSTADRGVVEIDRCAGLLGLWRLYPDAELFWFAPGRARCAAPWCSVHRDQTIGARAARSAARHKPPRARRRDRGLEDLKPRSISLASSVSSRPSPIVVDLVVPHPKAGDSGFENLLDLHHWIVCNLAFAMRGREQGAKNDMHVMRSPRRDLALSTGPT